MSFRVTYSFIHKVLQALGPAALIRVLSFRGCHISTTARNCEKWKVPQVSKRYAIWLCSTFSLAPISNSYNNTIHRHHGCRHWTLLSYTCPLAAVYTPLSLEDKIAEARYLTAKRVRRSQPCHGMLLIPLFLRFLFLRICDTPSEVSILP